MRKLINLHVAAILIHFTLMEYGYHFSTEQKFRPNSSQQLLKKPKTVPIIPAAISTRIESRWRKDVSAVVNRIISNPSQRLSISSNVEALSDVVTQADKNLISLIKISFSVLSGDSTWEFKLGLSSLPPAFFRRWQVPVPLSSHPKQILLVRPVNWLRTCAHVITGLHILSFYQSINHVQKVALSCLTQ